MNASRNMGRAARAIAVIAITAAIAACGPIRRDEPITGPLELTDASVQRGKVSFDAHCYKCHTQGEGGMGPIINDKPLPKALMRFQVRHGLGTMPAFSEQELGDAELEDILNYLFMLRHHAG